MAVGGEDVGVVLTIPGERPGPGGTRNVFNLAAWYVDEPHRWLAPRMLQKVVAQEGGLHGFDAERGRTADQPAPGVRNSQ